MDLANPARLLNDAGVATTVREPPTRWATWLLVEVFPKEPVIPTTIGETRANRADAVATKRLARWRSTGVVTSNARSRTTGTRRAPPAATTTDTPRATDAAAMPP